MALDKVLIVEDEPVVRKVLQEMFLRRRAAVTVAGTLADAEQAIARGDPIDLAILDMRLPDGSGETLLPRLAAMPAAPLVIVITGHGTVESAVAAMKAGAYDYLLKPFSPSHLEVLLRKAAGHQQLQKVNRLLSDPGDPDDTVMVGQSPAMLRLRELITRVAPTDATVFITGESGTGKEMVAREIFRRSPRRAQPFIPVNCAVVSETLMESEFFGHERGAFTGATERREGRFELANNGTLLLDEVSEISPALQGKLLRVLQEREFERVGGNKTIKVNVRILATSNRDLQKSVEKGQFRGDLYYRLNVFPVIVPTLRERPEDIPLLAGHFLRRFSRKHGIPVTGFTVEARDAMQRYWWPGNVRELQNNIERAVILSRAGDPVDAPQLGLPTAARQEELPIESRPAPLAIPAAAVAEPAAAVPAPDAPPGAGGAGTRDSGAVPTIAELERRGIIAALDRFEGNRTYAAKALGISLRSLRNKLRDYNLSEGA